MFPQSTFCFKANDLKVRFTNSELFGSQMTQSQLSKQIGQFIPERDPRAKVLVANKVFMI